VRVALPYPAYLFLGRIWPGYNTTLLSVTFFDELLLEGVPCHLIIFKILLRRLLLMMSWRNMLSSFGCCLHRLP